MQHEQFHFGNGAPSGGASMDARLGAIAPGRPSASIIGDVPVVARPSAALITDVPPPALWERGAERRILDAEHVPSEQLWRAAIQAAVEAAALAAELRQQLTAAAHADAAAARALR